MTASVIEKAIQAVGPERFLATLTAQEQLCRAGRRAGVTQPKRTLARPPEGGGPRREGDCGPDVSCPPAPRYHPPRCIR